MRSQLHAAVWLGVWLGALFVTPCFTADAAARASDDRPSVDPITLPASFNPLPELWGLRELPAETTLDELDASLALFVSRRARCEAGTARTVYFAGGRQVTRDAPPSTAEIADFVRTHGPLGALTYERDPQRDADEYVHVPAGVYRAAAPPTVTEPSPGLLRIEMDLVSPDTAARVRLRRLVCWCDDGDTASVLRGVLPRFAVLVRKEHAGFADPPVDDRPVAMVDFVRQPGGMELLVAVDEDAFGLDRPQGRFDAPSRARLDSAVLLGPARPGLLTWIDDLARGRTRSVDASDYFIDRDPYFRRLDRSHGIYFGDPTYWP